MGASQNYGCLFRDSQKRDSKILGSILGPPILGNYHICEYVMPMRDCTFQGLLRERIDRKASNSNCHKIGKGRDSSNPASKVTNRCLTFLSTPTYTVESLGASSSSRWQTST